MIHHTYIVTSKSATATLSGPVTAPGPDQAVDAAKQTWGVAGPEWTIDVVVEGENHEG